MRFYRLDTAVLQTPIWSFDPSETELGWTLHGYRQEQEPRPWHWWRNSPFPGVCVLECSLQSQQGAEFDPELSRALTATPLARGSEAAQGMGDELCLHRELNKHLTLL